MKDVNRSTSKFLSLVLRHQPELVGIELDPHGWVEVNTLLEAVNAAGKSLDRTSLQQIVDNCNKQRFCISEDGTRIRANQGHSVSVDLQLNQQLPPNVLYHGTVERFLDAIFQQGLSKGKRHHVHLSAKPETAVQVGSRRGKPVLLTVAADRMVAAGMTFYLSNNGVWLTDHVPAEFLSRLDSASAED